MIEVITKLKQPESDKTADELEKLKLMSEKQNNLEELKKMLLEKQRQTDNKPKQTERRLNADLAMSSCDH